MGKCKFSVQWIDQSAFRLRQREQSSERFSDIFVVGDWFSFQCSQKCPQIVPPALFTVTSVLTSVVSLC